MTFHDILNGIPLYALVIIGLLFIFGLAFIFFRKSYARALELGFSKKKLYTVIKSSVIFTIIPSIAIVIALFSLVAVLGIPWSWFRLSVVGSLAYELMAAEMAVTGSGYDSLSHFIQSGETTAIGTIMFVMSISILGGIVFMTIFGKKIQTTMQNYQAKDDKWGPLALSYFMLAIAVVFIPIQIFEGPVYILTLVTSAAIALLHIIVIQKFGVKWLGEFVLANSLILGMVASVFWSSLF